MGRITVSRSNYKFEHYKYEKVELKPYNGGYQKKLFKDHFHKIPANINVPYNASDIIYGKCK